jgi:hypothetical protein
LGIFSLYLLSAILLQAYYSTVFAQMQEPQALSSAKVETNAKFYEIK